MGQGGTSRGAQDVRGTLGLTLMSLLSMPARTPEQESGICEKGIGLELANKAVGVTVGSQPHAVTLLWVCSEGDPETVTP